MAFLEPLRQFVRFGRSRLYKFGAVRRRPRKGRAHGLPGELIVSLTSHPPRFATLNLTLACLFDQSVKPDRIILWIARDDAERVTAEVTRYRDAGLEIRACDDLGPFKKLVPALQAFPDAFIVTADDDLHYPPDWLETLVNGFDGTSIVCRWGQEIRDGEIDWRTLVRGERDPSFDIMPGSGMGILFPPKSLHANVTNPEFLVLCPTSDDLWYFWMAKLAGTKLRKVGISNRLTNWPGSQKTALWNHNREAGYDEIVARLSTRFA